MEVQGVDLRFPWLVSRKKRFEMRRRLLFARPGRLAIAQEFHALDQHESVLATAQNWLASLVLVQEGELGFRDGRGLRRLPCSRFLLYLPPGSLVRMPLFAARVETVGISAGGTPAGWPQFPLAVPCDLTRESVLDEQAVEGVLCAAQALLHRIDAEQGLSARHRRLRSSLYRHALGPTPVGHAANEHDLSMPVFSRLFTAAYGLSPRDYCQRVRVHAAVVALLGGISITHAALDSGWQDLSRFYRQFRQATGQTPGRYRGASPLRDLVK